MTGKAGHQWQHDLGKDPRRNPSVLLLVACCVVLAVLVLWGGISVTLGDALWFVSSFRAQASVIDLYWDGHKTRLLRDTPEYDLIQEAVFAEFSQVHSYAKGVGLSDESLAALRQNGRLLELHYASPTRIHTWYNFGASAVFYIPLSGFHAERKRVFNAGQGAPLQLKSIEEILAAAQEIARRQGRTAP